MVTTNAGRGPTKLFCSCHVHVNAQLSYSGLFVMLQIIVLTGTADTVDTLGTAYTVATLGTADKVLRPPFKCIVCVCCFDRSDNTIQRTESNTSEEKRGQNTYTNTHHVRTHNTHAHKRLTILYVYTCT